MYYPEATWLSRVLPPDQVTAGTRSLTRSSLFTKVNSYISDMRTTAFSVTKTPHIPNITVAEAAAQFAIHDLHGALGDYFTTQSSYAQRRGQRRSNHDTPLRFTHLKAWKNFRMQQRSTQDENIVLPARTIQGLPPSAEMPYGRGNTVLVSGGGIGERTSNSEEGE